jgi:hypothetical protein
VTIAADTRATVADRIRPLAITPQALAAAYDYLRVTAPFNSWGLPDSDEVEFHVTRHRDRYGDHSLETRGHVIRIATYHTTTTDLLMQTMAHEMIHARQRQTKTARGNHNWLFRRAAQAVCRVHGWDYGEFLG